MKQRVKYPVPGRVLDFLEEAGPPVPAPHLDAGLTEEEVAAFVAGILPEEERERVRKRIEASPALADIVRRAGTQVESLLGTAALAGGSTVAGALVPTEVPLAVSGIDEALRHASHGSEVFLLWIPTLQALAGRVVLMAQGRGETEGELDACAGSARALSVDLSGLPCGSLDVDLGSFDHDMVGWCVVLEPIQDRETIAGVPLLKAGSGEPHANLVLEPEVCRRAAVGVRVGLRRTLETPAGRVSVSFLCDEGDGIEIVVAGTDPALGEATLWIALQGGAPREEHFAPWAGGWRARARFDAGETATLRRDGSVRMAIRSR